MKIKFYRINETKGCFLSNEKQLCEQYCKEYGYTYTVVYLNV